MDIKLDTQTHDVDFSTGDLQVISGSEAIAQQLRIRLQFFLGEWHLDTRTGIPYYQKILVKNPATNVVRKLFQDAILSTPGIRELTSLELSFDSPSRALSVSFIAAIIGEDEPLIFDEEFII